MPSVRLAADPLWQCLCPSWPKHISSGALRQVARRPAAASRCLTQGRGIGVQQRRNASAQAQLSRDELTQSRAGPNVTYEKVVSPKGVQQKYKQDYAHFLHNVVSHLEQEGTPYLHTRLRALAVVGQVRPCRQLAEYIARDRQEKPNNSLYTSLIMSNISESEGAAWRVAEYLEEMKEAGIVADPACCHAVLKVLAVHPDHLLRADVLEYMRARWYQVSEEGAHDIAAGLLREGSLEQAMQRIDMLHREGTRVQGWLLDMAVYVLCAAGEVEEAHHIMRQRYDRGDLTISRSVWYTLLDTGSSYRHYPSTSLIWNSQVNTGYINPSSGICLNVLTTASQANDAVLATDVFSQLSKHGATFQPIHYQLLIECYLNASEPDLTRALSILTIMASEKVEPSVAETRALYKHLRTDTKRVSEAFATLRSLHEQGRAIPIAALNLLIECHVEQRNLSEALRLYKLMHTFMAPVTEGGKKTFADIETFNLLLRGCRLTRPPDEAQANFLVSELLAIRIRPTALTYDRLILVFLEAAVHYLDSSSDRTKGLQLLDWAFRHFSDMRAVSGETGAWMPRFGTVRNLATQLAKVGDGRCWDVLQAGEDVGPEGLDGWEMKGKWVRRDVEVAWAEATGAKMDDAVGVGIEVSAA